MAVSSLTAAITDQLVAAVRTVAPELATIDVQVRPSEHADLQANGLLGAAARAGRHPRQLASEVAEAFHRTGATLAHATVAGPGFLNLHLTDAALLAQAGQRLRAPKLGLPEPERGTITVIDYSNPNIAKHMHVGHLRSTVIGDALVRVLEHLGGTVIRQNHIGDWGTQYGMLIQYLVEHPEPAGGGMDRLGARYQAANAAFTTDPGFAERARQRVVALQGGDPDTLARWRELVEESTRYFTEVYAALGVRLTESDTVGESYFNPHLAGVVDDLAAAGVAQLSDGAWCAFPPGETGRDGRPLPLIVRKRDGGYGYAATDLAALRHRVHTLGAHRVLYVVDARQAQHLRMVFATAAGAGWLPAGVEVAHVPFGTVLGKDGRPLKTREGDNPRLVDLVGQAVERARSVVAGKSPDLTGDQLAQRAQQVGVGAVKYADLSTSRTRDYLFDLDRMLSLTGNTSVYLQYAHARVQAILRRAGDQPEAEPGALPAAGIRLSPAERRLALCLDGLADTVVQVATTREPHRLCGYLYTVAQAYTGFYETEPVLSAPPPQRQIRLALCRLAGQTLRTGLDLLGIAAPERL